MGRKCDICLHKDETLKATHEDIAYHFNKLKNTDFSTYTVGDSLAHKDKRLTLYRRK